MLNDWSHKVLAILKKYCPGNIKKILPCSQCAWNTRFYFGHQKLCMDNKVYCPVDFTFVQSQGTSAVCFMSTFSPISVDCAAVILSTISH